MWVYLCPRLPGTVWGILSSKIVVGLTVISFVSLQSVPSMSAVRCWLALMIPMNRENDMHSWCQWCSRFAGLQLPKLLSLQTLDLLDTCDSFNKPRESFGGNMLILSQISCLPRLRSLVSPHFYGFINSLSWSGQCGLFWPPKHRQDMIQIFQNYGVHDGTDRSVPCWHFELSLSWPVLLSFESMAYGKMCNKESGGMPLQVNWCRKLAGVQIVCEVN